MKPTYKFMSFSLDRQVPMFILDYEEMVPTNTTKWYYPTFRMLWYIIDCIEVQKDRQIVTYKRDR